MIAASTAGAIALALVAAWSAWRMRRRPLLLALQPALALALWLALWPLPTTRPTATLVVATAHTSPAQWERHRAEGPGIALPEAPALPGAQAVPDLATALRRVPDVGRLRILGEGLPARDREVVGARGLAFDPPPPRLGLVELVAPTRAWVGQPWRLRGRVAGLPGARVELLDPGGTAVATMRLPATQAAFELAATPPATGRVDYVLRVLDAGNRERERTSLALDVVEGARPRLWLLSGGPDPEQKFLRRWGEDAGLRVRAAASLGAGLRLGDPVPLDAASLAGTDLLVLDHRAWRALGAGARAQLRRAVADGLGLVLRLQEAPTAADRAALREFGFSIAAAAPAPVVLDGARAPFAHEEVTTLTRAPLDARAADGVVLARDAAGAPLARWRALGRGRVAAWWVGDSYRLVLAAQAPLHAQLWSQALATLARPGATPAPRLRGTPVWAQQRAVACGLAPGARVTDPDGVATPLLPEAGGCAAWWPARAGWHRIESAGGVLAWPVLAQDALPGVRAEEAAAATGALRSAGGPAARGEVPVPGPRWPGFAAWLLLSALAWWLERRRRGATEPQAAEA